MTDNIIQIDALFDHGVNPNTEIDPRKLLDEAEVIIGVDVMSQREFLLFGRDLLKKIAEQGHSEKPSLLKIKLDQDTDELEKLIALLLVVKGQVDYKSDATG